MELISDAQDLIQFGIEKYFETCLFKQQINDKETYSHPQSSLTFTLKFTRIHKHLVVAAACHEKVITLTINPMEYTCNNFTAYPISAPSDENTQSAWESLQLKEKLNHLIQTNIIDLIAPGLGKASSSEQQSPAQPSRHRGELPPRYEPQHPIPSSRQPLNYRQPPLFIPSIGNRDLDPFAASPGMIDSRFAFQGGDGGGMIVGPNHPIFNPPQHPYQSSGPHRPDQMLPPGSVPPGARFDPVSPFAPRPTFPARPPGGRIGGSFFGNDPDNDDYMPPGMGGNFYI